MKTVTLELHVRIDATINDSLYFADNFFEFETGNDLEEFLEECKDELIEQLCSINEEDENFEELEQLIKNADYEISYTVKDWGDVEDYKNLQDIDILQEIADDSDLENYDFDIINAGVECGIDISNIAEAYSGEADSDEDFAENFANELGYLDNKTSWPHSCIDWEYAARELMWDYTEANGYYFRNL